MNTTQPLGFPSGTGSETSAAARISTDRGLLIEHDVRTGDRIHTPAGPAVVGTVGRFEDARRVRLRVKGGRTLIVPADRLVRSRGRWIPAGELSAGDMVYTTMTPGPFGEGAPLALEFTTERLTPHHIRLPVNWSVQLAEMAGMFAARGCYTLDWESRRPMGICLRIRDADVYTTIKQRLTETFGPAPQRGRDGAASLELHSTDVAGAFVQLVGGADEERHVPEGIFTAPRAIVAAFLRGLWEARAIVHGAQLLLSSVEHRLLAEAGDLLAGFGITTAINTGKRDRAEHRTMYVLRMLGTASKQRFVEEIGFLGERKRAELAAFASRERALPATVTLPGSIDIDALKVALYGAARNRDTRIPQPVCGFLERYASGISTGITLPVARWCLEALDEISSAAILKPQRGGRPIARTRNIAEEQHIADFLREIVDGGYHELLIEHAEPAAQGPWTGIITEEDAAFVAGGIVVYDPTAPVAQMPPARDSPPPVQTPPAAQPRKRAHIRCAGAEQEILQHADTHHARGTPEGVDHGDGGPIIAAGTIVNTERGLVAVDVVRPGDYIRAPFGPHRILEARPHGNAAMHRVHFSNGRTLTLHPGTLLSNAGRWMRVADCMAGDPVTASRVEGLFGTERNLHLHYALDADAPGRGSIVLPARWTVELAELLGYMLGNGPGARDRRGRICAITLLVEPRDQDVVDHLVQLVRRVFAKEATVRRRTTTMVNIHSIDIGGIVDQLGMGDRATGRAIPRGLRETPREIIAAFLRGYTEARSHYARHDRGFGPLKIGCAGLPLAHSLAELLGMFGIVASIDARERADNPALPSVEVVVGTRASRQTFFETIGFLSARRRTEEENALAAHRPMNDYGHIGSNGIVLPPGQSMDALMRAVMRQRNRYPAASSERTQLQEAFDYLSARHTELRHSLDAIHRMSVDRMQWLAERVPSDLLQHHQPYITEALRGRYAQVYVDNVEEVTAGAWELVVEENAAVIAGGMITAGNRRTGLNT